MAGRRRRAVPFTADEARIKWARESHVLKRAASLNNSDEWPCFVLTDAVVYDKDGSIVSLLQLDLRGPFTVRGKLEVEETDLQRHLVKPSVKTANIEIQKSASYSIGYGPYPVVWAAGEAGWFEINPSPRYAAMYDSICEAVNLYYKIMEVYEKAGGAKKVKTIQKIRRDMPLDEVFYQYAVAVGDGSVRSEVEQRCRNHAEFLLAHFRKETEFKWEHTSFCRWMVSQYPDIHQKLQNAPSGQEKLDTASSSSTEAGAAASSRVGDSDSVASSSTRAHRGKKAKAASEVIIIDSDDDNDVEMADAIKRESPVRPRKGSSPARVKITPVPLPAYANFARQQQPSSASISPAVAQAHVQLLLDTIAEIRAQQPRGVDMPTKTLGTQVYYKCRIADYAAPLEIISFYAKPLLAGLPAEWKGTAFHTWLTGVASQPYTLPHNIHEKMSDWLVRRRQNKKTTAGRSSAAHDGVDDSEDGEALSSSAAPAASASTAWRKSHKSLQPPVQGRRSGKAAGLRLATTASKKRRASEMDDDDDDAAAVAAAAAAATDGRGRKTAKMSHYYVEDNELEDGGEESSREDEPATPKRNRSDSDVDADDDDDDDDDDDNAAAAAAAAGDSSDDGEGKGKVHYVIRAHKIPSMSPRGPNGTWVCEEEGCGYVVRSARDAEGQALIDEHFESHMRRDDRIDLAVTEGTRGHNPINNLIEKLRAAGAKAIQKERVVIKGRVVPQPIKRRVFP